MSAATMNEMERLRRERDEARAERDALAAKLEEIELVAMAEGAGPMMRGAIDSPPAHTIATLKAEWQAEAFWQFITDIEKTGWETAPALVVNALYTRCAELRRQAERGKS